MTSSNKNIDSEEELENSNFLDDTHEDFNLEEKEADSNSSGNNIFSSLSEIIQQSELNSEIHKKVLDEDKETYFKINSIKSSIGNNSFSSMLRGFENLNITDHDYYLILSEIVKHYISNKKIKKSLQVFLDYKESYSSKIFPIILDLINQTDLSVDEQVKNHNLVKSIINKITVDSFYEKNNYSNGILSSSIQREFLWPIELMIEHGVDLNKIDNIKNTLFNFFEKYHGVTSTYFEKFFDLLLKNLSLEETEIYDLNYKSAISSIKHNSKFYDILSTNLPNTPSFLITDKDKTPFFFNVYRALNKEERTKLIKEDEFDSILLIGNLSTYNLQDLQKNNILHEILLEHRLYDIPAKKLNEDFSPSLLLVKNSYGVSPLDIILNRNYKFEIAFAFFYIENFKEGIREELLTDFDKLKRRGAEAINHFKIKNNQVYSAEFYDVKMDILSLEEIKIVNPLIEIIKIENPELNKDLPDNNKTYNLYTQATVNAFEENINEYHDTESRVRPWLKKIKTRSGVRKLAQNTEIKKNISELRATFPNFRQFIDHIEENIYLNERGAGDFYIPPSLLVSPPGIGKTFFLNTLAKFVGVTYDMINMESVSAGFALVGGNSQWSGSTPGLVFQAAFKSDYANNILILDEIDKTPNSNYPVDSVLLPLLEEHTARAFKDEFVQMPIDIRKMIWVATANNINKISAPIISRFEVFNIKPPTFEERKILTQAIYNTQLSVNVWGASFNPRLSEDVLNAICSDDGSSRDLRKLIMQAVAKAAKRGANEVGIQDLILGNNTIQIDEWDRKI